MAKLIGSPPGYVGHEEGGQLSELDESVKELILAEGFSEEYGARNLERVVDRMLGTLIAEALLGGKITAGQTIRIEVKDGSIQIHQLFPEAGM